jgi:parallel beta-helix repeat protein
MNKRSILLITWIVLVGIAGLAFRVRRIEASSTIYIRSDGSIDPSHPNITQTGDVYTLVGNVADEIVVEKSGIVIDGNGFILQGSGVWKSKGLSLITVSNVTVHNTTITDFDYGIYLNASFENVLSMNTVTGIEYQGIFLLDSANNTIAGNLVEEGGEGIRLEHAPSNTISDNTITNQEYNGIIIVQSSENLVSDNQILDNHASFAWATGVIIHTSSGNKIISNNLTNNDAGIRLLSCNDTLAVGNNLTVSTWRGFEIVWSQNVTLQNNCIENSQYGFGVSGDELSHYIHSIDTTNLVDGKPIHYLQSRQGDTITPSTFPEIGYLALVNSTTMMLDGLQLTKGIQGLLIAYTNHTGIRHCNFTDNEIGISLVHSDNNTFSDNRLTRNGDSLSLWNSSRNRLLENTISFSGQYGLDLNTASHANHIIRNHWINNSWSIYLTDFSHNNLIEGNIVENTTNSGIYLEECQGTTIRENTIMNCALDQGYGIELDYGSSNNHVYHNNFIDNADQAYAYGSMNFWDNGLEGNYWSGYPIWDGNHDGIGDVVIVIEMDNIDHFPLMGRFARFNTSLAMPVNVITNSTLEAFDYFAVNNTIHLHVSNQTANQAFGFCRISIPKGLITPPYTVTINNGAILVLHFNNTLYDNSTHRWIYFAYPHSELTITIIPEVLPLGAWIPVGMVTLLIYTWHKRRRCLAGSSPNQGAP